MGKFFHCSSCRSTKCLMCWMNVPDLVINDLLSSWIADVDYQSWVNTCKVCGPENADRCPATCPGRRKYSIRYGKVVPDGTAYSCHCEVCCSMTAAYAANKPVEAKFCTALPKAAACLSDFLFLCASMNVCLFLCVYFRISAVTFHRKWIFSGNIQ